MSACLSDYSLATDSGVFEPPAKRLEADLPSCSLRSHPAARPLSTERDPYGASHILGLGVVHPHPKIFFPLIFLKRE